MNLSEVTQAKIDELNELSVTDDGFKEAAQSVCNLVETENKTKKESVWAKIGKVSLAVAGIVTPFVLNALNNRHDNERLDKVLEYEKTGVVMSSGGKQTLSSVLKFKH